MFESCFSAPKSVKLWSCFFVTFLLLAMGIIAAPAVSQTTSNIGPAQGRQVSLQQQLTAGLKVITNADKAFINRVVLAVEQGRLPRKLVDSTFLWSRYRAARKSYTRRLRPIVYFQPALTLQAKRIGILL